MSKKNPLPNNSTLNFGIIGNCKSAALINEDSTIEWCCLPQFDSPSVFGKIIDSNIGGHFKILCDDSYKITQTYVNNTSILCTLFENEEHAFEVLDFMPRYLKDNSMYHAPPQLSRVLRQKKGNPRCRIVYKPRLEYALGETKSYVKKNFIVSIVDDKDYDSLFLYSDLNHQSILEGSEIEITKSHFLTVSYNEKLTVPTLENTLLEYQKTKVYWLNWCSKTPSFSNYNSAILRSAMTLKLLTFEKTGAVLAAATTSLPETIGEVRNWDYRFCWIRDASMVIKVIAKLGHVQIVKNFINYIIDLVPDKNEKLQIMYGISGEKILTEKTLDHLDGYEGSKPVRVGNAAYTQKQNDIYGILMDVIHYQIERFSEQNDEYEKLWTIVKSTVWVVENNWRHPDKGIWEFRHEDRHFTFSKLLCWVAVDRAIKISQLIEVDKSVQKWEVLRDEIYEDIMTNAWSEKMQAFTQSYQSDHLDASVLLMEYYDFIDAKDPKYIKTVNAIEKELMHQGLLFRYKNEDDFGLPSSSFTVCTFWFINSLYKIGETEKSQKLFDELLSYGNHLGLFSEDIDFSTKRLLGNFPQAYSHLALIDTAMNFN
ncbi:MAG TPA: glycoside hydrolase family 15 protein [Flavobacteriaceae bacterium]|nr:MAG: Trehalase [Flavobacteriaceae bacterium]HCQ25013.1 glycoside hydrolase family 15 protein [Flavobacteriaceae bacterium]|tara:strand:+ start:6811 stop:8598 length:1788 start_codon:yes stop_codon:yes gene_type:complete